MLGTEGTRMDELQRFDPAGPFSPPTTVHNR